MTSQEFVMWLKGFMEACNDLTATTKQWDKIKEELEKVSDGTKVYSGTIAKGGSTTVSQGFRSGTDITYLTNQLLD
jgi:hypothetical protein